MAVAIRDYRPGDEQAWLRCRVLAFLGTAYFDDVCTSKQVPSCGAALVAVAVAVADGDGGSDAADEADGDAIIGVLDLSVDGPLATIDTIAVHPDYQGAGVGTALFEQARIRAAMLGAVTIDAWTRDDEPALGWYRASGFTESEHYLHVYADYGVSGEEPLAAVDARPGLQPVKVFLHAPLAREEEMRRTFRRVHICRRFSQPVIPG